MNVMCNVLYPVVINYESKQLYIVNQNQLYINVPIASVANVWFILKLIKKDVTY